MQPVVVLSDLHLGQTEHSMIKGTNTYKLFFEDMTKLKDAHGDLKFVLAGDIFDLWRDYAKKCVPYGNDMFRELTEYTKKDSDITYVIGNHDHYFKMKLFGDPLYGKINMSEVEKKGDTLKALKGLRVDFDCVYPDLNLKVGNKKICITHGHFLTEEIFTDDWFIRLYLLWAKFWHKMTPSRDKLEQRKIKTYQTIFARLVKTFDTKEHKKTYDGHPKEMQEKNYDGDKKDKLRNNWEIMNMKRTNWKLPCDLYVAGHTHLPGIRKGGSTYKTPYLNSGIIQGKRATYLVIHEKKIEIRNVGKEKVCKDLVF